MMTQREKLIELIMLSVGGCARHWAEVIADYLLANGVVVLSCRCSECELYEQESCPMWDNGDDGWGAHWQGCDNGFCHEATKRR